MGEQLEWFEQLKTRLRQRGFAVEDISPEAAEAMQTELRRQDADRIASGLATPDEIQRENSLFPHDARIEFADFGSLMKEAR